MTAPLLYPFSLGMLATVNPCGFPLLPAYLEMFAGVEPGAATAGGELGARARRAVAAGAFCTVGFVGLFGLLGLLVDVGWAAIYGQAANVARYLMVCAGLGMVGVGLASLLRSPLRLRLPEIRGGVGLRRPAALAVFGVSYGVASIGCALPLFIGGVATSFTADRSLAGSLGLVCYALGMGTVLSSLALAIAVAGPAAARPLRRLSRFVPALGAMALILIGLYLAGYWLTAIVDPTSRAPAEGWVLDWQSWVASAMSGHAVLVGSTLGGLIVAAILVGGFSGSRRPVQLRAQPRTGNRPAEIEPG